MTSNDVSKLRDALDNLEKLICCDFCKKSSNRLSFIALCDHVFCTTCIGSRAIALQCPECKIDVIPNNVRPVRQFTEIAEICTAMRRHMDEYEQQCQARENLNEAKNDSEIGSKMFTGTQAKTGIGQSASIIKPNGLTGLNEVINRPSDAAAGNMAGYKLLRKSAVGNATKSALVGQAPLVNQSMLTEGDPESRKRKSLDFAKEKDVFAKRRHRTDESEGGLAERREETSDDNVVEAAIGSRGMESEGQFLAGLIELPDADEAQAKKEVGTAGQQMLKQRRSPATLKRNSKGETDLHFACEDGDFDAVQELLEAAMDPNVADQAGFTPLHRASAVGHAGIVDLLLEAGAVVDPVGGCDFMTPLHLAISYGNLDVVSTLISHGADVDATTALGDTALMLAAKYEHSKGDIELILGKSTKFSEFRLPPVPPKRKRNYIGISYSNLDQGQLRTIVCMEKSPTFGQHFKYLPVFDASDTTHLVVGQDQTPRSYKYLIAVLTGKWVVKFSWILASLRARQFVDEEEFEVKGSFINHESGGPKRARENFQLMKPGLFAGFKVYLHGYYVSPDPTIEQIRELIRLGQGTVEEQPPNDTEDNPAVNFGKPYHAGETWKSDHLIIYSTNVKPPTPRLSTNATQIPLSWLIDCIDHFRLLPFPNCCDT